MHRRGNLGLRRPGPAVSRLDLGVTSGLNESVQDRYKHAIVDNSLAATQQELLADAGKPTAQRVVRQRAWEAAGDLGQALAALQTHRRLNPVAQAAR